jgi:hypothetical protein
VGANGHLYEAVRAGSAVSWTPPAQRPGPGARIGDQFILYRAGPWIGGFRDPGGFKWASGEPFWFRDFPFSHVKLGAMVGPVVTGAIAPVVLQR